MKLIAEQNAFLLDISKLINYINLKDNGIFITGGELWRTPEMQKIYIEQGKSKTTNSMHLKRLAIDLNFFRLIKKANSFEYVPVITKEELKIYGDFWEGLNPQNRWGGNFNFYDGGHFERHV